MQEVGTHTRACVCLLCMCVWHALLFGWCRLIGGLSDASAADDHLTRPITPPNPNPTPTATDPLPVLPPRHHPHGAADLSVGRGDAALRHRCVLIEVYIFVCLVCFLEKKRVGCDRNNRKPSREEMSKPNQRRRRRGQGLGRDSWRWESREGFLSLFPISFLPRLSVSGPLAPLLLADDDARVPPRRVTIWSCTLFERGGI